MSGEENGNANHLNNAIEKLNALLDDAKTGALIPIRLPGQIEAILNDVHSAQEEAQQAQASPSSGASIPADMEDYMAEEAPKWKKSQ